MAEFKQTYEEKHFEWNASINLEGSIVDEFITFSSPHFNFADSQLYIQLGGKFTCNPEETTLGLIRTDDLLWSHPLLCTFGLKKLNGNVIMLGTRIMKVIDKEIIDRFAELSEEITQRSEEILRKDIIITFTLKLEVMYDVELNTPNEPKHKKLQKEDILSQNFKCLYADKETTDVIMLVKDKEFQVHRAVLIARSKVFAAMFRHDTTEKCLGIITIPDCDSDSFHHLLEYLYCGNLGELSFQHAFDLYETSEKYDVQDLKIFCREQLTQNVTVERFCEIVHLADKYSDASLKSFIENYFQGKASDIIKTPGYDYLLRTRPALTHSLYG